MVGTKKIREDLILDDKDSSLILESSDYYVLLVTMLGYCDGSSSKQFILLSEFLKTFNKNDIDSLVTTMAIIKNIYATFEFISDMIIMDFDIYHKSINQELYIEKDPDVKAKKSQILSEFNILSKYMYPIQSYLFPDKYNRNYFLISRETFPLHEFSHALDYCREDILLTIDTPSINFSKEDLDKKLKIIFENIIEISSKLEVNNITYEISRSREILLDLSEGKEYFKIPFITVEKTENINLIRLMKYWEIEGYIEIDNWIGDENGWNIRSLNKKEEVYLKLRSHRDNQSLKKQLIESKELFIDTFKQQFSSISVQDKKGINSKEQNSIVITPYISYNKKEQCFYNPKNGKNGRLKDSYARMLIDLLIEKNEQSTKLLVEENNIIRDTYNGKNGGKQKWGGYQIFLQSKTKNIRDEIERKLGVKKDESIKFFSCSKEFTSIKIGS